MFPPPPTPLKLKLRRMPLAMYKKRGSNRPTTAYRSMKKAEVFGYTRNMRNSKKNCWTVAIRAYFHHLKRDKFRRHTNKFHHSATNMMRIEAATAEHGLTAWDFRNGLADCHVQLNHKMMGELAITEPKTFHALAELAHRRLAENRGGLESLLRPELAEQGVVRRTGLVHREGITGGTKLTKKEEDLVAHAGKVPRKHEIPPPEGWRILGHYPGNNLIRVEKLKFKK